MNDELNGLKSTATGVAAASVTAAATDLRTLINTLCPDGVEWKTVGEVYKRLRGTPITAHKMQEIANQSGDITIFAGGKTVVKANSIDIPKLNAINMPAVLVQSRGVIDFIYYDHPFTFKNEMWAYTSDSTASVKYLYYMLKNNVTHFRTEASSASSLPQISIKSTENFRIPVPPLAVQEKIVQILDKFTELAKELAKEKQARRAQYEYYRDWLLDLAHPEGKQGKVWDLLRTLCPDGVEWKTLGECSEMQRGTMLTQKDVVAGDVPVISGGVKPAYYHNTPNRTGETVTVASSGASSGYVQYWNQPIYVNDAFSVKGILNLTDTKFLYYYLKNIQPAICATKIGGGVPHVRIDGIKNFRIPVPPLPVQAEIVRILDQFSTLAEDITTGLPAEIAARQTQYEYYRNQLLSFKER